MFVVHTPFKRPPVAIVLTCMFVVLPLALVSRASQSQQDSPPQTVPIFVSDFELQAVPSRTSAPSTPNTPKKPNTQPSGLYQDTDSPSEQARLVVDTFSKTLVQSLQSSKFSATRQSGSRPTGGVLIRGVFAEPDAMNRVRRGLLGSNSPGGKFLLYVGIFNLSRPDAPLYELAAVQEPDSRYGPVITLNNYIPLAKFEVTKNPSEEDIRKICAQVVDNLTALLANNPAAFSQ
jgi:Domain of unknown function (DUF4410)